jgi:hypothetical protein
MKTIVIRNRWPFGQMAFWNAVGHVRDLGSAIGYGDDLLGYVGHCLENSVAGSTPSTTRSRTSGAGRAT